MSTNSLPHAVNHFPTSSLQISTNDFLRLGAISLAILAAPFVLWGIWILVRNWGAWKVRSRRPSPHYIRTWHGWVEAGKHADKMHRRRSRKGPHWPHRIPRTTTADYGWIFWDPRGRGREQHEQGRRNSILRYLPSWARSYRDESVAPGTFLTSNQLYAVEEGRITIRSFHRNAGAKPLGFLFTRYQSWPRRRGGQDVNSQLQGSVHSGFGLRHDAMPIFPDSEATEEEYGYSRRGRHWKVRGHGLTAADCSPFPSLPNVNKIPVESDLPCGTSALVLALASPAIHEIAYKTASLPAALSLLKGPKSRRWFSDPNLWESVSSHSAATPKLHKTSYSEGLAAPHVSEKLPGSRDATSHRRWAGSDGEAVDFAARETCVPSFRERLRVRMQPLVLNPYQSAGREYSGTCGRPTSPATSWVARGAPAVGSCSSSGGESGEERPIARTTVLERSIWSSKSSGLLSVDETWNLAADDQKPKPIPDSNGSFENSKSHQSPRYVTTGPPPFYSIFHGSSSLGQSSPVSSLLPHHKVSHKLARQWSTFPTRRIKVSLSEIFEPQRLTPTEQSSFYQSLDTLGAGASKPTLGESASNLLPHDSCPRPRYKIFSSKLLNRRRPSRINLKPVRPYSMPEESFLDDLDRRLRRLDYELSPGFRGPRGAEAESRRWYKAVPSSFSVTGTSHPITSTRPDSRRPLNLPYPIGTQSKPSKPRRYASLRFRLQLDGSEPSILIRSDDLRSYPTAAMAGNEDEPEERAMDTGAWLLRRPPMDARPSRSAEQILLYAGSHGQSPKTLAEWQNVGCSPHHGNRSYYSKARGKRGDIPGN